MQTSGGGFLVIRDLLPFAKNMNHKGNNIVVTVNFFLYSQRLTGLTGINAKSPLTAVSTVDTNLLLFISCSDFRGSGQRGDLITEEGNSFILYMLNTMDFKIILLNYSAYYGALTTAYSSVFPQLYFLYSNWVPQGIFLKCMGLYSGFSVCY